VSNVIQVNDDLISFHCPGCGHAHSIKFGAGDGQRWLWNENKRKPTFSPSILYSREQWFPPVTPDNLAEYRANPGQQTKQLYVCHSFVTDGTIQFLSDCTHELAGKNVDLPEFD
jgi:hypothetical protein